MHSVTMEDTKPSETAHSVAEIVHAINCLFAAMTLQPGFDRTSFSREALGIATSLEEGKAEPPLAATIVRSAVKFAEAVQAQVNPKSPPTMEGR